MHRRSYLAGITTGVSTALAGCSNLIGVEDPEDPDVEAPKLEEDAQVEGTWPQFQFDNAKTGYNPNASGPNESVVVDWAFESDISISSSPTIANDTLVVGVDNGTLLALDTADGRQLWRFIPDDDRVPIRTTPTVKDGVVYYSDLNGDLYAIDITDGAEFWSRSIGGKENHLPAVSSSPTVAQDTVYIGGTDATVLAFDTSDGSERWRFKTNQIDVRPDDISSTPAVVDGSVYVGGSDGYLYSLDASNGSEQWNYQVRGSSNAGPAVVGDRVYVGGGGNVYALNVSDGSKEWDFSVEDSWVISSPAVANGVVYVGSGNSNSTNEDIIGHFYALDGSDGSEIASLETDGFVHSSPCVADGVVYFAEDDMPPKGGRRNRIFAMDADSGNVMWTFAADKSNVGFSSPIVVDETIFISGVTLTDSGPFSGSVYALREE